MGGDHAFSQRGGPPTRPIRTPQPRAGQGPRALGAHPCAASPKDQAGVPRDRRETQPPGQGPYVTANDTQGSRRQTGEQASHRGGWEGETP